MPTFDPALPRTHAPVVSAELRGQFNGLKSLIDAVPGGVGALRQSGPTVPGGDH